MGEVISIGRSNDDDLFGHFEKACPKVPTDIDETISQSAARALGGETESYKPSFRNVCLGVAGVCCVGILLAHNFTKRWNTAVDTAAMSTVTTDFAISNKVAQKLPAQAEGLQPAQLAAAIPAVDSDKSWHRTRAAWVEYITRLESDPFYQYVEREKRRFKARYPDQ